MKVYFAGLICGRQLSGRTGRARRPECFPCLRRPNGGPTDCEDSRVGLIILHYWEYASGCWKTCASSRRSPQWTGISTIIEQNHERFVHGQITASRQVRSLALRD